MRITDVRAVQPLAANSPPDWRTSLGQILVAVDTDAGLTGYGVGGGGAAGVHVVRTVLRERLLGRDPDPVESLGSEMYAATLPFGRKGLAVMALSGVDLALWDLRGRSAGRPIAELLGGRVGDPIETYVTVWSDLSDELAANHRAFKLHLPDQPANRRVSEAIAAVDRARKVIGPTAPLMVDVWMRWDLPTTLAAAEELKHFGVQWIEEPLSPDDLQGYGELSRRSAVPIAGGEHEFTAIGFAPLVNGRLHQVLQPDVCWCGGLTELIKIYHMAEAAGLRVCPHRGAEVWALHAIAALDAQPLAESGRPWMTWVGGQPGIDNGTIRLTDAPGFGVMIDEASLP